jgi:preprotein translocase subunit YajC
MFAFLSQAFAASAAVAPDASPAVSSMAGQGGLASLMPFLVVLGIFYFLLIRPQQRRVKQHQDMVGGLKKGDRVITGGGIIGTINKVDTDDTVQVQIAEGVTVQVARTTIISLVTDTATVAAVPAKSGKNKSKQVANDN